MRAPLRPLMRKFSSWGSSNCIAPESAQGEDSEGKVTGAPPKDPAQEGEVTSLMDTMLMMRADKDTHPWFLIDPRHSLTMKVWDVVTCTALLFTAVITPYEVGFLPPPESSTEVLFILNRMIDIVFLIDIGIHFILMYPATDSDQSVIWVQSPKRIMLHYLKTWFLIDTISSLVSITDIVAVYEQDASGSCSPSPSPPLSTLAPTPISPLHTRPRRWRLWRHRRDPGPGFVWNTGGTRKGCRKAPCRIFLYVGFFLVRLAAFCFDFRLPNGAGFV